MYRQVSNECLSCGSKGQVKQNSNDSYLTFI